MQVQNMLLMLANETAKNNEHDDDDGSKNIQHAMLMLKWYYTKMIW